MPPSDESKKLLEKVKANHERLRACEGPHEWVPDPDDLFHNAEVLNDRRCTRCGGTMGSVDAVRYSTGVEHGRRCKGRGKVNL